MKRIALASLCAATLLAGCATPAYVSPVEVTRFVGASPQLLGRGPIAVRAGTGADPQLFEQSVFQTAVAEELAQHGYVVSGGVAEQVAEVWIERATGNAGVGGGSPVSVGVGGSTGSYGSGAGVGVGINLNSLFGGGRPRQVVDTQLRVVIRPSAGGQALWEGRAQFSASANSPYAGGREAAERVADALFGGFPGRSGETIEVR
jgi:hypothetical protein